MPKTKNIFQLSTGQNLCTLRYPPYFEEVRIESKTEFKDKKRKRPKMITEEREFGDPISAFDSFRFVSELNKMHSINLEIVSITNARLAIKEMSGFLPHVFPVNSLIVYDYPNLDSRALIVYEERQEFNVMKIKKVHFECGNIPKKTKALIINEISFADINSSSLLDSFYFGEKLSNERRIYLPDFPKLPSDLFSSELRLEIIQERAFIGLLTCHSGISDWENRIGAHINPLNPILGLLVQVPQKDVEKVKKLI